MSENAEIDRAEHVAAIAEFNEKAALRHIAALEARVAQLEAALKPFVELADKRDDIYRKRGGNGDAFPDYHPAYDITAEALPLGVWRRARAALKDTPQ